MRATAATLAALVVAGGCSSGGVAAPATTLGPGAASVTLAPPDAYPVIDASDAADASLAPGVYRIREPHQATWPPQCLDEMIVFPPAGSTTPTTAPPPAPDPNWEATAIAALDRIRELRGAICPEYDDGER